MIKKCFGCGANMGGTGDVGNLCISCKLMENRAFVPKEEFIRVKHERDYLQEQLDKMFREMISLPPRERALCIGCSLPRKIEELEQERQEIEKELEMFEELSLENEDLNSRLAEIKSLYSWCMTGPTPPDYEGFANSIVELIGDTPSTDPEDIDEYDEGEI